MTAIVTALAIAAGGILSPGSALLTLLVLSSPRGLRKALSYYAGYFGSYTIIGVGSVLVSEEVRATSAPSGGADTVSGVLSIALGLLMLFIAFRTWRAPPEARRAKPKLFETVDQMTPPKLAGLGVMIAGINLKNLSIFVSAIAVLVEAELPRSQAVPAALGCAFVFCLAVLGPIVIYTLGGSRSEPLLARLRRGLETHARRLVLTVLPILGSLLLIRGIDKLAGG